MAPESAKVRHAVISGSRSIEVLAKVIKWSMTSRQHMERLAGHMRSLHDEIISLPESIDAAKEISTMKGEPMTLQDIHNAYSISKMAEELVSDMLDGTLRCDLEPRHEPAVPYDGYWEARNHEGFLDFLESDIGQHLLRDMRTDECQYAL